MRKFSRFELESMEDGDRAYQPPEQIICERCGNEVDEETRDYGWKLCPGCAHQVAKDNTRSA
jgi:Zn finger protein HypA/HybF involved in hydrogenase expression